MTRLDDGPRDTVTIDERTQVRQSVRRTVETPAPIPRCRPASTTHLENEMTRTTEDRGRLADAPWTPGSNGRNAWHDAAKTPWKEARFTELAACEHAWREKPGLRSAVPGWVHTDPYGTLPVEYAVAYAARGPDGHRMSAKCVALLTDASTLESPMYERLAEAVERAAVGALANYALEGRRGALGAGALEALLRAVPALRRWRVVRRASKRIGGCVRAGAKTHPGAQWFTVALGVLEPDVDPMFTFAKALDALFATECARADVMHAVDEAVHEGTHRFGPSRKVWKAVCRHVAHAHTRTFFGWGWRHFAEGLPRSVALDTLVAAGGHVAVHALPGDVWDRASEHDVTAAAERACAQADRGRPMTFAALLERTARVAPQTWARLGMRRVLAEGDASDLTTRRILLGVPGLGAQWGKFRDGQRAIGVLAAAGEHELLERLTRGGLYTHPDGDATLEAIGRGGGVEVLDALDALPGVSPWPAAGEGILAAVGRRAARAGSEPECEAVKGLVHRCIERGYGPCERTLEPFEHMVRNAFDIDDEEALTALEEAVATLWQRTDGGVVYGLPSALARTRAQGTVWLRADDRLVLRYRGDFVLGDETLPESVADLEVVRTAKGLGEHAARAAFAAVDRARHDSAPWT